MMIKEIMSKEDLKRIGIGWIKNVLDKEYKDNAIIYKAQSPYRGYNGYQGTTVRAYVCRNNSIELLFSNLNPSRAYNAIRRYNDYLNGDIESCIWENYITNGHNTRKGLNYNYSEEQKLRMSKIAQSHADYMGQESGNSSIDHYNRVEMR